MDMWMIWLIVAVLFAIVEIYTPSFFMIWFSVGSIAASITSAFTHNRGIQFLVFIIVSFVLILFTRKITNKFKKKNFSTNSDMLIGKIGIVKHELKPLDDNGRIEIMGQSWKATLRNDNESANVGEKVKVISIDGVTLNVEKVD